MIDEHFSKEFNSLLNYIREYIIRDYPSLSITPEYIVLGMLQKRDSLAYIVINDLIPGDVLGKINIGFVESISRKALKIMRPNINLRYSPALDEFFNNALNHELPELGGKLLNSLHVLLAILHPETGDKLITKVFQSADFTYARLLEKAHDVMSEDTDFPEGEDNVIDDVIELPRPNLHGVEFHVISGITPGAIEKSGGLPRFLAEQLGLGGDMSRQNKDAVSSVCTNLNEEVLKGNIDKPIGREVEYSKLINVLGRRKKNNAIIVGGDGIGKTAICEGLAYKIVNGDVPSFLAGKTIWSLNLASLMSGTQFRGILEDKMQKLIDGLKKDKKNILFIDDISAAFTDKKNSDVDFATILNSMLIDNSVQMIGSCSFKGWRSSFDNNPSLARKFQKINIEETSVEDTKNILMGIKENYEEFHNVVYTEEAIDACIRLSQRYITDRHLPDSAIDVLDEAGAKESIRLNDNENTLKLRKGIIEKENEIVSLKKKDAYDEVSKTNDELRQLKLSLKKEMAKIKQETKDNPILITKEKVYDIISEKTGIPLNNLTDDDKKNILSMNETLKKSIIGQDEAIDAVCKAIKRNRVGLGGKKTMGAFFMCGKTGCGKSLLAKQLAKEIFGDEKYLVRIDMSEYEDKTAVNKLIGSSAGYVGYENGGVLTEAIKNKKYCVLLLDEFEKADPEIYNLFLQVFDEGYLNDNTGQKIDFKNTIVILTSNVGAKAASDFGKGIGFGDDNDKTNKILEQELKKKFSPEFLNRLDDVIYFNKLTPDNLKNIIRLELDKTKDKIELIGHSLTYTNEVVETIYNEIQTLGDYGARPVIRTIQTMIENPITDLLLENNYEHHIFQAQCCDNVINVI